MTAVRNEVPQPAERVLWQIRPSLVWIVLRPLWWIVGFMAIVTVGSYLLAAAGAGGSVVRVLIFTAAAILLRLIWQTLEWWSRSYVLTDHRLMVAAGVLRRDRVEIPLRNVRHVTMHRSILERIFSTGTIGVASAGTADIEAYLLTVSEPGKVLATIRDAVDRASADVPRLPLVVGLAGGIGAGKSSVAAAFREIGCVVSDSDAENREVLTRPEVRRELVRWWGEGVLDERGEIDRRKVAERIFADPAERKRLEGLTHPLIKARRAERLAEAARAGAPAMIIDAPLLFEAGVDRECDAVVFVDAPADVRAARVRASRGWDEAELARREAAQMSLEEKRRRCHYTIDNSRADGVDRAKAREILGKILSERADGKEPSRTA